MILAYFYCKMKIMLLPSFTAVVSFICSLVIWHMERGSCQLLLNRAMKLNRRLIRFWSQRGISAVFVLRLSDCGMNVLLSMVPNIALNGLMHTLGVYVLKDFRYKSPLEVSGSIDKPEGSIPSEGWKSLDSLFCFDCVLKVFASNLAPKIVSYEMNVIM